MLQSATTSGRLDLTAGQQADLRDRLADALWYVALLAKESARPSGKLTLSASAKFRNVSLATIRINAEPSRATSASRFSTSTTEQTVR